MPSKLIAFKPEARLPYPTVVRRSPGKVRHSSAEYVIPASHRKKVLLQLYPFADPPKLSDVMIDIHCDKRFVVKDYKVVRELGRNWLTSPYYYESGGTVIDWWPEE